MTYQTGKNIQIAFKQQGSGLGSPESGSGGTLLRLSPSPGLKFAKTVVDPTEVRADGQTPRGRHGTGSASGSYTAELSVGTLDDLLAAVMRATWTATFSLTSSDFTSTTTTASTIVGASGSFLTSGVRVGDMVKITGATTTANNNIWLPVVDVSATTITVPASSLTLDASADTGTTLAFAKALIQPTVPVEQYFTVDQYYQDLDQSLSFTDVKFNKLELQVQPNKTITCTLSAMGLGATANDTGASPVLTSPSETTTLALSSAEIAVRVGGALYTDLSAFTLTMDLGGAAPPVIAANPPDVFLNNAKLSGSFTRMRGDLSIWSLFDAETQIDLFVICSEPGSDPKAFTSFYVGNAVLDGSDAPLGNDGAMTETVPWRAGQDVAGSAAGHATTMLKIASSAA